MRFILLISLTALCGCTESKGRYPSLLPRPIESTSLAEPERPAAVATPDAALDKRIAEIRAALAEGSKNFTAGAQDAEAKIAVSRGLPQGSEAWLQAQVAMGSLAELRRPAVSALSELEEMATQRGVDGLVPYPALDAAVAEADQAATQQQARIDSLEAALGGSGN
jgi:multidrug resistance efflux pump